jgi:hypothetical protein
MYGTWNFGAGKLKVGKDYTPVSQFVSGQVFDEDLGLLGIGTQYGNRTPQIVFSFGGFDIAFVQQKKDLITGLKAATTATFAATNVLGQPVYVDLSTKDNGSVRSYLPKFEASYGMSFDAWNFGIQGGYQYYTISGVTGTNGSTGNDVDVTSYTIGGNVGFNFGPAYAKGAVSYGQNWGQAAWGLNGFNNGGSDAYWDGDDGTDDTTSYQFALVAGMKATDMLSFEAGFGYRNDDPDVNGADDQSVWAIYGQSVIAMAPGVYIIPEVGYYDYGDAFDGKAAGNSFYLGAKWQIDF